MYSNATPRHGTAAVLLLLFAAGCGESEAPSAPAEPIAPVAVEPEGAPTADTGSVAVDSELLPYAEVGDNLIYGHFAFPSDMVEPLPAIVLIHDVWGLNDDMRALADRLAAMGYMVLAVDMYGGSGVASDVVEARAFAIQVIENPETTADNIRQALDFVGIAGAPSKAALGYGLGGTWSLNAAERFPDEIDAAIMFYGQVIAEETRLEAINAPVLGLFGARDRAVSLASVTDFEAAMRRLGKRPTVQIYSNAGHAFADPSRRDFDEETAADAWQRTVDFLKENLPSSRN